MTVFVRDPLVTFYHIPKTAGTSISEWLIKRDVNSVRLGDKHMLPSEALKIVNDPGFTFTCVRNPWDRLFSLYNYYNLENLSHIKKNNFSHLPFDDWVINCNRINHFLACNKTQANYVNEGINYVMKYETIDKDFKVIQDIFKDNTPLHITNIGNKNKLDYRKHYTSNKSIEIVLRKFKADIKRWNYTFE